MTPRPTEVVALRQAILTKAAVRLTYDQLWSLWVTAAPRLVGDTCQSGDLSDALAQLAAEGVIELPKPTRSSRPALLRSVLVPGARKVPRAKSWQSYPWRAELGWVSSQSSLSDALFGDLVAINDWLKDHDGKEPPIVPSRYRSAEIFGREKRLDELTDTTLFADDHLTLDILACKRIPPPLAAVNVGPGPDLLVVENSDTYWVAVDALRRYQHPCIGAVAWGAGRAFPAQTPSLRVDVAGRGPLSGTVWYWGDFDPQGTAIAVAAARTAGDLPIRPAIALWTAMADVAAQEVGQIDWTNAQGSSWFGPILWNRLEPIRAASGRVAQEAVAVDVVLAWAKATA